MTDHSERLVHTIMNAISLESGRSTDDLASMLRLLDRIIEVAAAEGITDDVMTRQVRNIREDLSYFSAE